MRGHGPKKLRHRLTPAQLAKRREEAETRAFEIRQGQKALQRARIQPNAKVELPALVSKPPKGMMSSYGGPTRPVREAVERQIRQRMLEEMERGRRQDALRA